MVGLTAILKEVWNTAQNTEDFYRIDLNHNAFLCPVKNFYYHEQLDNMNYAYLVTEPTIVYVDTIRYLLPN